jgi:hypothetical protein
VAPFFGQRVGPGGMTWWHRVKAGKQYLTDVYVLPLQVTVTGYWVCAAGGLWR